MQHEQEIINLIKREVVPAIGCTEPIAVALCTAKATELLGTKPEKIKLSLSANIIKNAMGVGIPGTGMTGLPIAVALGALIGKSAYSLEVLRDCTPNALEAGKQFISDGRIAISLAPTTEKLFIDVECCANGNTSKAVIAGQHTNFILLKHNNEEILNVPYTGATSENNDDLQLTLRTVWEFATTTVLDKLRFILETRDLNDTVSRHSLDEGYGHQVGRVVSRTEAGRRIFGDTTLAHIVERTAAACDARMAGCPMAVMSNSGSGNQGISATMPVVAYADDIEASEEQLIRALALSHLTVIYIKQSLGRLSALCGCVVAASGASAGIAYLMGGGYEEVATAVTDMAATLTGMLCDGAKPSCALKVATGVYTAAMCAALAVDGRRVQVSEGIIDADVDKSIRNMTAVGRDGMLQTDALVLNIMTNK